MLARPAPPRRPRRGAVIAESALTLSVFLMLLFGLFEYGRFLMVLHLANNAARDGARYAAVNLGKPSNFDTVDYTDGSGNVYPSVTSFTNARMASMDKNLQGYAVAVTARDQNGTVLASTTWNQVSFPKRVGVSITGNYRPVTPVLLFMPSTVPVVATAAVVSEG